MDYPSQTIQKAVEELSQLPGIGKKTALRLALFLLKRTETQVKALSEAILALKTQTKQCKTCNNLSEEDICRICSSSRRTANLLCVVEDIRDLLAIERTGQYQGLYHVLGGLINPMQGISPSQLSIPKLIQRVSEGAFQEIIFALTPSPEGDTTAFYLYKQLAPTGIAITILSRGVPVGSELEFTDELTLSRAISQRVLYSNPLQTTML
ncbi:MAG: recombination mediator RecR [Bacteroidia bacterium]|nr:recombination mediator RecR [Bacteroidia bacterium]